MMRVLAVVEGVSEELLLRRVLAPHLGGSGVFLEPMQVLRGGGQRGGGSSWQPWRRHIEELLRWQPKDHVCVTTMLDLYRIPKDTPGLSERDASGDAKADRILSAVHQSLGSEPRFIPYVQVHELEALLFSDLSALTQVAPWVFPSNKVRALAREVLHLRPEAINEGETSAPSKRLLRTFKHFRKTTHAVEAMEAIGLARMRAQCHRFDAWVTRLESLGNDRP